MMVAFNIPRKKYRYYTLDERGEVVGTDDVMKWGLWMEHADRDQAGGRRVGGTQVGDYWVSTVFLGLDHNWGGGPPVLWETMIFPTPEEDGEYQERYSSKEDAIEGHEKAVEYAKNLPKIGA